MSQSSANNRSIRVFVSSTFRDMQEERDQLMSHTWPALRQFCRERQVEFVEVDLRWGIPEAQSTRNETLKLCLNEIRACRPYFIGLVGERYGWVPSEGAVTADLLEEEPWLTAHRHKSVTELEILHGVLNNPEMAGRAFFYVRDPAYAQTHGADYLPEDPTNAARQRELKSLIRETCTTQKIPLRENYPNPRRVAEWVLADLQAVIEADYPRESILDPLTREARDHEAFAESRRRTYIGRTDYFETLDRHALGDGGPLVLLGDSGSGKSALLANWVSQWRETHPQGLIIQHYIGSAPDSASHWGLMKRVIDEIKRWTDDPEEIPSSHDDLLKTFPIWLAKARSKAEQIKVRCLLILDALNQLEDQNRARHLGWLPTHSFAGPLRLITSTLPGEPLQAAESRGWATLQVEPLTTDERRRMIAAYLERFRKKLDEPRIERLATAPHTANPLYLKTLLDDLRVTGTHERLDERLNGYLAAQDIPALLQLVLARYQRDYERDRPGLVGETLGLIWAARRGLSETELLELLRPVDQPQLPAAIWAPLRYALEDLLVDRGGLLNFAHEYLQSAVESTFVPDKDTVKEHRLRLANFFEAQPISDRNCDELPWLLWQTDARARLRACLLDIDRFILIHERDRNELMSYWVGLGEERTMGKAYSTALEKWIQADQKAARSVRGSSTLGVFLIDARLYDEAELWCRQALEIYERSYGAEHPYVATSLQSLGRVLQVQNQLTEAESLYRQALATYERCYGADCPDVAACLHDLASVAHAQNQLMVAEPLYRQALAIYERCYGGDHPHVAACLHDLASVAHAQNRLAESERLIRRALDIYLKVMRATGHSHPHLQAAINNYIGLLDAMGLSPEKILARLNALGQPYGMSFGNQK